jgi:GDP-L-fucose synthase
MKIGILGSNGFVGSSLVTYLSKKYKVVAINRSTTDLLDPYCVKEYLRSQHFDVIVNAAAVMTSEDSFADTRNNLGLFMNFYNNSELFGKFINLGSGAEFDRSTNIDCARESLIFDRMPKDSYGFGQNIKSRLSHTKKDFYTLRLFNCFGSNESSSRIFSKFLSMQDQPAFEIQNDRYFDYFSIQDLCKVVDSYVTTNHSDADVNCVYYDKHKISEVVEMFANIHGLKKNFTVVSTSENNYTGSGTALEALGLNLDGLKKGLELRL